jgi:hypothetical protein
VNALPRTRSAGFDVPIVFIVYRRPEMTRRVFERIRELAPDRLYVIADGPRDETERGVCEETRAATEAIDWRCETRRIYADENLGCGARISSGLDHVFREVEEAIVLEDDCLPHDSFFGFCRSLLERYRNDERVMHIGGSRFEPDLPEGGPSYRFSKYSFIWGWATWKRAWSSYDFRLARYAVDRGRTLASVHSSPWERRYWKEKLALVRSGELDTWDYQWNYALWEKRGVAVVPGRNLVTNIGVGCGGTHEVPSGLLMLESKPLGDLRHPSAVKAARSADREVFRSFIGGSPPPGIVVRGLRKVWREVGMLAGRSSRGTTGTTGGRG